jgi:hypothetical protein
MELWPLQAEALYEALSAQGLIAMMGVGSGKTLTSALLPTVLKAERPLVLTRAALIDQQKRSYRELAEDWNIHSNIEVWSYHDLSQRDALQRLRRLRPDIIVADEAHRIARDSARTNRLFDYFLELDAEDDPPILCALSGTLFRRRLEDMWRPFFLALGDNSPIPFEPNTRRILSTVIDTKQRSRKGYQAMAQAAKTTRPLLEWAEEVELPDVKLSSPDILELKSMPQRTRDALSKRAYATRGVMGSAGADHPWGLEIYPWLPPMPGVLLKTLTDFEDLWMRPDGQFIDEAMEASEFRRQVSAGFYYRWDWPDGKPDIEWLERRSDWGRYVRREIEHHRAEGYDTPALVRAVAELDPPPELIRWKEVEHRPEPPRVAEWLSTEIVEHAARWLENQDQPTIMWSWHTAVLDRFRDMGLAVYGPDDILDETVTERYIVATAHAHGEGKNLQFYNNQLILHPPPAGGDWEQLIGRMDRPGQLADTVTAWVAYYCPQYQSDLKDARKDAKAIEVLTRIRQRLNKATWVDFP